MLKNAHLTFSQCYHANKLTDTRTPRSILNNVLTSATITNTLIHSMFKKSTIKALNKWVKVFKNGPSKICGRQSLRNFKFYGLLTQERHWLIWTSLVKWNVFGVNGKLDYNSTIGKHQVHRESSIWTWRIYSVFYFEDFQSIWRSSK